MSGLPGNPTTSTSGYYSAEVTDGWSGTVTPQKSGYSFSPPNLSYSNVASNQSNQNYTGKVPVSISYIEINQALGFASDFVAGKDTAIRVFLDHPITVNLGTQYVTIKRDGSSVATLGPVNRNKPTSELTFLCPTRAACGNWQQGNYTFDVSVDGAKAQTSSTFQERDKLRILVMPVKVNDHGQIKVPQMSDWINAWQFMSALYPIASGINGVEWEIIEQIDATDLNLNVEDDRKELYSRVKGKQPNLCGLPFRPACYDKIIGFIPPMMIGDCIITNNVCSCKYKLGYTYPNDIANIVMTNGWINYTNPNNGCTFIKKRDSLEATVAHEIAHNYDVGDEYNICGAKFQCGINAPPASYQNGTEWESNSLTCDFNCASSTATAWSGSGTGSTILSDIDHPFDVGGRGALPNMLSFMGSGGDQSDYWITPWVYWHLFDELAPATNKLDASLVTERVVQAFGWISQDGQVTLEPWYHATTSIESAKSGAYTIEAVDSLRRPLASQRFEVSFIALTNPATEIDPAPFDVRIAFPSGTEAFLIKHQDLLLAEIPVSPNPPDITLLSPNGGENWGSNEDQRIIWSGSDPDGDQIKYRVLYSPNGNDWITLAANILSNQLTVDTEGLPGSESARIEVVATDGVNTSFDESDAPFAVSSKAPIAFIKSPEEGASIPFGNAFYLNGLGYDAEDGTLGETAFQWQSNKDGYLGAGSLLLVRPSYGEHTITLTATDSDGYQTSVETEIFVGSKIYLPLLVGNKNISGNIDLESSTTERFSSETPFAIAFVLVFSVVGGVELMRRRLP
jgi:hypothetical protein